MIDSVMTARHRARADQLWSALEVYFNVIKRMSVSGPATNEERELAKILCDLVGTEIWLRVQDKETMVL